MRRPTVAVSRWRGFVCRRCPFLTPSTPCAGPAVEPAKWVGGRWREPWEKPGGRRAKDDLPSSQRRPATADRLVQSSRVSPEDYACFYKVQTGAAPTRRVLAAFVASQSLAVAAEDGAGRVLNSHAPTTTAKQRRNQQALEFAEAGTRYWEPYPRPARDPSGHDPRGGAGHTFFASRSAVP